MGINDFGSNDADRDDDFLDSADWMADVPATPAFEEDGWLSDELDERVDVVIRNPEAPLRFVRPHSGWLDASGLVGGGALVEGPETEFEPG